MAVPRRRHSKARRDKRRAQNIAPKSPGSAQCPQCRRSKLPHRVCIQCGFYKGREIIKMT